ncbi:MAG: sugar phosphate nucleotidyltransferase [bacterium]|nr:sugar phosphate nucleotidyltransferase [bacterium]
MKQEFKNFGVIILAAGQGKRLNCAELPKVLHDIGGRPILSYILNELEKNGVKKNQVALVVGFKAELVREAFGPDYVYAMQAERLGTAHAAMTGEKHLPEQIDNFIVLNGDDSAFYEFSSLAELMKLHGANDNDLTILTCEPDDSQGLGRVIRDGAGRIIKIVEKENMTPELEKFREINTGTFCFNRKWFLEHYPNLRPFNSAKGEYGLPSFIEEALASGSRLGAVKLENSNQWFGINTPEQLAEADKRKKATIKLN